MGIRSKIKKRLPIFGRKKEVQPAAATPAQQPPKPPVFEDPKSERGDKPVQEFLQDFTKNNKIVLFMKGSPTSPQCGFSANAAGILSSYGIEYSHFDVLSDPDVRTGVKDFSQWPTLPQIYIGGEFMGGSDILTQMHQSGELAAALEDTLKEEGTNKDLGDTESE